MESFAAAFPSESEDLMVLLDAFIERRWILLRSLFLVSLPDVYAGL
jgi:hypothetical protein